MVRASAERWKPKTNYLLRFEKRPVKEEEPIFFSCTQLRPSPQPSPKGRGSESNIANRHRQTMTYNSFGPCTPMVSVNSISAVREGPVIKVIARLVPDCPPRR